MDIEKTHLVEQVREVKRFLGVLEDSLRTGVDKATFLARIVDAEDGLKRLRALVIHHSRVHGVGVRRDGKADLRFSRNCLNRPGKVDLRKPAL